MSLPTGQTSGVCSCDDNYEPADSGIGCVAICNDNCLTCDVDDHSLCLSCHPNMSLPDGQTSGVCSCDDGFEPTQSGIGCVAISKLG